ncbi:MAG: hypothetical protein FJ279_31710, partial [Planctomycetes bacterium]|nr:hypothetical protein [Planctomycetota bacterium]
MKREAALASTILLLMLCLPGRAARGEGPDWTFNMAVAGWVTSNAGNRYHTFTSEAAEKRAAEIAAAGFKAVMTNGYHFRLNFAGRDADIRRIAKTIADACHKHGLKVVEHHDWTIHFYDGYPYVFQRPYWLQVNAADMITRHRIFCINNPEFQEAYLDYLRRYQRETDTDAYQLDEIQWLSREYCGCRHCREKYKQDTGRDCPPTHDAAFWEAAHGREDYRHWMRWRSRCLGDFRGRIGQELRKVRPDVKMFTYTTVLQSDPAGFDRGAMIEEKGRYDDTLGTEVNSTPFVAYPYIYATQKSRLALAEALGKPTVLLNNLTPMTAYFVWAFGRTCRASLWYHLVEVKDGPPQERLLKWPYQMDDSISRSAADIAVFLSASTRDLSSDRDYFHREFEGWLQALCLNHNDARVLLESQLKPGVDLASVRLIVLPNVTALSSEQAALLLDYVRKGGRLLLTHEAGTLDEHGAASATPLLVQAGVKPLDAVQGKFTLRLGASGEYELRMKNIAVEKGTRVLGRANGSAGDWPLLTARQVERGQVFYLAAKLGPLAFEDKQMPTSQYKSKFAPPKNARAVDMIAAAVDVALADVPRFRVLGAPRGLLATIYAT